MIKKVKVSNEVATCFQSLFSSFTFRETMEMLLKGWENDEYQCLRGLPVETVATAYLAGYETDKPEDRLLKTYRAAFDEYSKCPRYSTDHAYYDGFTDGVREALDTLKIKIKGVND